jgi:hypothetical protein
MPSRAMKLAVFFGSIHGVLALTAISQAAVEAPVQAKDCLAAPDHQPMQGGQWRYRTDPATKRHCWYVRGEGQEIAQPASSSAKPAASPNGTTLQETVVDARAEITPAPANIVNGDVAQGGPQVFGTLSRALFNGRAGGAPNVGAGARHRPQPASAKRVGPPAPRSVWMLLSALGGALGLVGMVTAVIARIGRRIAMRRRKNRGRVGRNWSARPSHDITSSVRSSDEAPMDWVRIARQAQEAHRQSEQIEQLLARVSRRSAV